MTETPPFADALPSFLRFVDEQGFSTDLLWVFREDVTNCRRDIWVRVPVPAENVELAREYYDLGRQQGLGVTLELLCRVDDQSACFVWVPKDEIDASYAMQGPLKLSVAVNPVDATPVRSRILWCWRSWLNRWRKCVTFADHLPLRDDVRRRTRRCT